MSALNRFTFISLASLGLGLGLAFCLGTVGCQQPQSYCTTAHGDFAASYKLKSGDPNSACGQFTGDVIGLQTYFAKGGLNGTPKFSEASMTFTPAYIGDLIARAASYEQPLVDPETAPYKANALAPFTASFPDDDEICKATKFKVAEISLPELPLIPGDPDDPATPDEDESTKDQPAIPASTIRYEWSNARVLVNANYQGTQLIADLKFTQDDCTAEYEVIGVYPVAGCETDADCQITENTALNPDFDVKCQTDLGFCVLRGGFPALK